MVAAVLLLPSQAFHPAAAVLTAPSPSALDTNALTMAAQVQLDQLFGAGHSRIVASANYTDASVGTARTYHSPGSVPLSASSGTGPGYSASGVQNGVSQTVTQSSSPGGVITRLSVAVVVDASKHPNLRAVRKTVAAAMGVTAARGDRLSVVSAPFAVPAAAVAVPRSWTSQAAAYVPSATALIMALVLAVAALSPRRVRKGSSTRG
ncbi:flagellar M-ring protein FliF C-terminal domain-containing protein [Kineosporia mesophila]|nr:flagellar M-ring protein FliF C-terminal domain-containing protein [Kineosporia mesophila]MCD5353670.1 hypothetical protein [Kineosporia mesophila]